MQIDLTGKKILVTGGSRGIGAAIVRGLARAGATVGLHYGESDEAALALQQTLGEKVMLLKADLSSAEATMKLFEEAVGQMQGIDTLVNNAGVAIKSPIEETPEQVWLSDWQLTQQINLTAAAILSRRFIQHCQAQQQAGRLIFVSSRAAFRGDTADYMAYAASKGGMVALSRSIARAFGKQNIVSFVLAPGFIQTDMAQDFIDAYGADYVIRDLALNSLTQPDDIAPWAVLLASGKADHATGCTIDINAGSYVH